MSVTARFRWLGLPLATTTSDAPAWPGSQRPSQARPGLLLGLGWPLALALVFASQRPWLRPWLFVQTGDAMMTVT